MNSSRIALVASCALLCACPPPAQRSGSGPQGPGVQQQRRLQPPACGAIDGTEVGRKIHAFLVASAELDAASYELEESVHGACRRMAVELGIPADGDTATLCDRVAVKLEKDMQVSVSQEQRLVTRTKPPVCTTQVEFAAEIAAQCEAVVQADVTAYCQGYCRGTCNGVCDGTCASSVSQTQCAGACDGSCRGSCSGQCEGSAQVEASAECKAAAEVRADVRTVCTEPEVVIVTENVTIVDTTSLDRANRAIDAGMPTILRAGAKGGIVARSLVHWGRTAVELSFAGIKLLKAVGDKSICVGGELAAAVAAAANISARIDVSIQVSARFEASAGIQ